MSAMVSDKVEVEFEIDVECVECRVTLEAEYERGTLKVTPCPKCMEKERKDGFDEGRIDADEAHSGDLG